ncbi:MAG TPA: tetratricopeptide repeat protein [Thermoanaerobaculia bacterium]|nr:tetratricopeptide repeat protein [Thermoanaerobaculia bacterium]
MRRSAALLICIAGSLLALGCASSRSPLGSADLARALRARGFDPSSVIVPFEITAEMKAWAHAQVPDGTPAEERLDKLLAAMIDPTRLKLQYEAGRTLTASEAFEKRRANCLAFTSLFVGMARELGVPAHYLDVDDVERFEKDGDLLVVSGHVSAGYDIGGARVKILDFSPNRDLTYRRVHRISDLRAVALFYANQGAESLRAGHSGEALTWLRKAVQIDPEFGGGWVNLGVALRREGSLEEAEAAYRRALEADPQTSSAYSNLAAILRSRGEHAEAERLLAIATNVDRRNPFSYLALGDLSLAKGRLEEARRFYRRALRLHREDVEAYAALGLVAFEAGQSGEARKWLRKAESMDRLNERVRKLGDRLADPPSMARSEGGR